MIWQTKTAYEFGPFHLDATERQLLRDGEPVPLRPKVFDVLLALVQNSGHILSKDEVMELVWPNTVVEEGNISRNISSLRVALGERRGKHNYIETIPWRGYRFIANVKEVRDSRAGRTVDSIAVLPFLNVTGDSRSEYLSDGLTESLTTNLAHLTNLRVTSRNSAFRFKGSSIDVARVGQELKVQALLMGRVAEHDDLVSISVELVETSSDRHLWGGQYFRKPAELFAAHETIAREIVEKLRLELTGQEQQLLRRGHTKNNDAYLLFLKGRYHFNKLTPDGVARAAEQFEQAIEKDANYALAYAGLADCHNYLNHRREAKESILKALELNETLGEAHASLGFYNFLYDWDFAGAEQEFKRALELSPNYAEAHHWYGIYLANVGRHEEASRAATQATELDPLSMLMNMTPALNFYLARQYDLAIEQLQRVIELEPNFVAARSVLGSVLIQQGLFEQAMNEFEKVLNLIKGATVAETSVMAIMCYGFAKWGKRNEALKLLDEVARAGTASHYTIAGVFAALGDIESAFRSLDRACEQHDVQMVSLKVDPTLDVIRSDQRFAGLMSRVGIPH